MPKTNGQVADWAEADAVLGKIRQCDADAAGLAADRDAEKARIDQAYASDLDALADTRKAAAAALRTFCKKRRKDFGDAKSRQLDNGVVGWRLGKRRVDLLTKAKNWATALTKIVATVPKYARIIREIWKAKIIEDHEAGALTDEQLAACDLRVTQAERFYIEPKTDNGRDREGDA